LATPQEKGTWSIEIPPALAAAATRVDDHVVIIVHVGLVVLAVHANEALRTMDEARTFFELPFPVLTDQEGEAEAEDEEDSEGLLSLDSGHGRSASSLRGLVLRDLNCEQRQI
jgi:hypothetical protein